MIFVDTGAWYASVEPVCCLLVIGIGGKARHPAKIAQVAAQQGAARCQGAAGDTQIHGFVVLASVTAGMNPAARHARHARWYNGRSGNVSLRKPKGDYLGTISLFRLTELQKKWQAAEGK